MSRLTARRPTQTHSGLPAGPANALAASANSSIFFVPSGSAAGGRGLAALGSTLWATHGLADKIRPATPAAAATIRMQAKLMVTRIVWALRPGVLPDTDRIRSLAR